MQNIYAPKRSCPRDLGFWYCDDCRQRNLEETSDGDYPIELTGCGKTFGDKICGKTHLGFSYCDDCKRLGREKYSHFGEYEIVGTIIDADEFVIEYENLHSATE